jgi:hypothetical protein
METNPYNVPAADPFGQSTAIGGEAITEGVLKQLKGTKGWVKLMAIILFLIGGLMVMGGLAVLAFGIFGSSILAAMGDQAGQLASIGGVVGASVLGVVYAALGAIYLVPGFKLWNYGSTIDDLLKDRAVVTLEKALDYQRSFWKFIGVFTVVMISVYVLIFIAMIIFGGIAAAMGAGGVSGLGG